MERVEFTYKRGGRKMMVSNAQATVLQRAGLGTYENRSMADKPAVTKQPQPAPAALPASQLPPDGLGELDKDQLHALAKERGVYVHHMAGADKVRAALREAQ